MDAKAGFAGLVTAAAEATGEPTGLRIADNVTLRKEGALIPRPVSASTALPRAYRAAFPYRTIMLYVAAGNAVYHPGGAGPYDVVTLGGTTPAVRDDIVSAKEARGNFYFASALGALKLTAPSSIRFAQSGSYPGELITYASSVVAGTLLAPSQKVAYRFVTVKTDVNGVIVRSRPTGATTMTNTGGGAGSPQINVYGPQGSYDSNTMVPIAVEIYRTRVFPTSVQADDEMQLVATITYNPSVSYVQFIDNVPDANRGTTLYTSPSRGGMEAANDPPPGAACMERFRTSMFFGNVVGPHRVTFSYKYGGNRTGQTTLIGERTATANVTNGSTTMTSVSNTTGLQPGMFINNGPGGNTASMGRVVSISGSTVTTSLPANANATGQTFYFNDALVIDSNNYSVPFGNITNANINNGYSPTTSWSVATTTGILGLYSAYEITPPAPGYDSTVVLERRARGGAPFQLRASHGDELSPAVPLGNAGTGMSSAADVFPHGLAWSEPDEPEHVPPKNFARVGDAGKAILALVATKDRLLIFKEDGLFMLTGNTARDFGIYPLDTTCLCILPGSVRRLKNTVYLLSNLGIVAVDEGGGVSVISRPIQLEVAVIVNAIRAAQKTTGLYNMPGLSGVTGAGDDAQGEYHLALGSSTPSFGGQVLVYSIPRDGFTTFSYGTPAPVALATDGEGNPLVLTASSLLTPTTTLGAVTARVSPRAFSDPALVGKLWTHIVAGFSQLTGTTSVQAKFTSSESQDVNASITETFESAPVAGLIQLPNGSLLRHPLPRAVARAYLLFVELIIGVSNGTFTLETIAAQSREDIPNKRPSHGTGAT